MTTLLLRSLRRLTSVEESLDDFAKIVFGSPKSADLDLTLSVYEIDDATQLTRARTEHCASFCDPPQAVENSVSLHGFPDIDISETPGDTAFFQFTREKHREMNFFDEEEILSVAKAVQAELKERQSTMTDETMWTYVSRRLAEEDREWQALCEKKKKWRKWAARHPNQRELL